MLQRNLLTSARFYKKLSTPKKSKLQVNSAVINYQDAKKEEKVVKQWDIFAAVALMRTPVIAPPMSEIEQNWAKIVEQIDAEKSLQSDYELDIAREAKLVEKKKKLEEARQPLGELEDQLLNSWEVKLTKRKLKEDKVRKEYNLNNPVHYEAQDVKSLQRKFDRKLILLVRQKFKSTNQENYISEWKLPQLINNGESLKKTAERCLLDIVSPNIEAFVLGNTPLSHYKYYYPKKLISSNSLTSKGAHVFIYASIFKGSIFKELEVRDEIYDYCWCTPEEVKELILQENRYEAIAHTLLE